MYKTIAESNNFIVLDKYTKYLEVNEALATYQTEAALEKEFIQDLINQGYEHLNLTTLQAMLANVRVEKPVKLTTTFQCKLTSSSRAN